MHTARAYYRARQGTSTVGAPNPLKVFVLDPDCIYRRGLAASLELLPAVETVTHAGTLREAWERPELLVADVVMIDGSVVDEEGFGRTMREARGAAIVMCAPQCSDDVALTALQAGAVGFLRKDTLTPASLEAAVGAAASGAGVVVPDVLSSLIHSVTIEALEQRRSGVARLTNREQQVLALIAEGNATREVAEQLCYSERTVKNVLHDVVTKLNARTRSQAVAFAVREGLI